MNLVMLNTFMAILPKNLDKKEKYKQKVICEHEIPTKGAH